MPLFGPTPRPILPLSFDSNAVNLLTATRYNDKPSQRRLLASSLDASIACLENGSTVSLVATPPSDKAKEIVQSEASMLVASQLSSFISDFSELGQLSLPSRRIQEDFENSDLQSIDISIGAIKSRIEAWFASGKIWQAILMRVHEVSDTLVEDAIIDRSFEEADLAMVHAAGRLNESVKRISSELANEINALDSNVSLGTVAMTASSPSAIVMAKNNLLVLASQKEPIDPFKLARHIWAARQRLEQSDILEDIPQYIRKSLLMFWSGNAFALTATAASTVYFGVPAPIAISAVAAQSLVALFLLDYLGLAFAALIAVGGAIGYFKSNSVASLVSGLVFGALISLSAQLAAGNSRSYSLLPAGMCLILFLVMAGRFISSKKFMPAGMVAITSLFMVIRYALKAL
ncbi:Transmembrane protein 14C [Coemansia brasiliensis]|uniref:Transmembrane protein 14C n=1 Tax=Coemansia brasiliensis TaxID=2650707 RepID=A0A9W8I6L4_9FUNG|nr:Transmembrane protein 14C [Coemansia brasiliensis]